MNELTVIEPTPMTRLRPQGLKARVQQLLISRAPESLTLGDISKALGMNKLDNPDISAVLAKLRNGGLIKAHQGPASSARGRRFVKRYAAVIKAAPAPVVVLEMDVRRQLAFTR